MGQTGKDGKRVEVKDMPAMRALVYTWKGSNSAKNRIIAKAALESAITECGKASKDFRILGYKRPGVPNEKKTWVMLVVFTEK